MKKLLLLLCALTMSVGTIWADKTVYLNPGGFNDNGRNWASDNAVFVAYVVNADESENAWIDMTETLTLADGTVCYKAVISDTYTKMVLIRDGDKNHDWSIWNQTQDITLSTIVNNTLFTITGWNNDNNKSGCSQSVVYTAKFATNKSWANIYAYAWTTSPDVNRLGGWPGTKMTATGDTYSVDGTPQTNYSITFASKAKPEKIIFNDGTNDDSQIVGINQTADLTFKEGKQYVDGEVTNHTFGLMPTILSANSTPAAENLAYLTDGDLGLTYTETTNSAIFGNQNPTIFYYDLGAKKDLGRIVISWTGAHANTYKIYAVDEAPADAAAASALTDEIVNATGVSVPAGQNSAVIHDVSGHSGRYIVFVATAFDYGCTMHEFAVYDEYTSVLSSVATVSGTYIYNAAQEVPLFALDQEGIPYAGSITSISFTNSNFGYAVNTSKPSFTFGADFPNAIDDIQVTAGKITKSAAIGFLKDTPDTEVIPSIEDDTSYIVFSAEKNQAFDIGNAYGGDGNTSVISDIVINGKTAKRVKAMKYVTFYNNYLSNMTDMTGLVLDIFVTKDHVAANCHIEAEGVGTQNFPTNLVKGWNHVVLSDFTAANLSGLNTNKTLFVRIDDASSNDEEVVIYNLYYTKEVAADDEKPVMVSASEASKTHNSVTLTLNATDNSGQVKFHIVDSTNGIDVTSGNADSGVNFSYTVTDLTAETTYDFTITAVDAASNVSDDSKAVEVTTNAAPLGFDVTSTDGAHEIHVYPYHIAGTTTYTFVVTTTGEDVISSLGNNCYWYVNGNQTQQLITLNPTISADGHTLTVTTTSSTAPKHYNPLYLDMPGEVMFTTGIQHVDLDWIDVVQTSVSSYQWASFSNTTYALDFGKVAGLKAYIATEASTSVSYEEVTKVPASTGLILNGEEGTYYVPTLASAAALGSTNLLHPGAHEVTADEAATDKYYAFGRIGENVGFVKALSGYNVSAGKSYLVLTDALAKGLEFIGLPGTEEPNETNGINAIEKSLQDGEAYNLAGQRVDAGYKGIVIINGKKYVRK
ncbi:MAG: starch-binding protein [Prevotella sp.]|nr:starch-binding protein [Prevotella sp.]